MLGNLFKEKIKVNLITPIGRKKKKYPVEGNHIIIRPAKRGRGGGPAYKAEFDKDCVVSFDVGFGPFKFAKKELYLIEGADHCISFHFAPKGAEVNMPTWDRYSEEDLFKASVIKAAGASTQKVTVPTIFYVLMFMTFAIGFINFLMARGMLRF